MNADLYWSGIVLLIFVIMLIGLRPDTDKYR